MIPGKCVSGGQIEKLALREKLSLLDVRVRQVFLLRVFRGMVSVSEGKVRRSISIWLRVAVRLIRAPGEMPLGTEDDGGCKHIQIDQNVTVPLQKQVRRANRIGVPNPKTFHQL